jgi:hypothetical protein
MQSFILLHSIEKSNKKKSGSVQAGETVTLPDRTIYIWVSEWGDYSLSDSL